MRECVCVCGACVWVSLALLLCFGVWVPFSFFLFSSFFLYFFAGFWVLQSTELLWFGSAPCRLAGAAALLQSFASREFLEAQGLPAFCFCSIVSCTLSFLFPSILFPQLGLPEGVLTRF